MSPSSVWRCVPNLCVEAGRGGESLGVRDAVALGAVQLGLVPPADV